MPKTETLDTDKPEVTAEVEADLAEAHAEKAEVAAEKAEESAAASGDVAADAADLAQSVRFEGEPNGLPPAAPEVALEPGAEVIALREWKHLHIDNSVHSQDTEHYNRIYRAVEALAAMLQSKHPVEKNV